MEIFKRIFEILEFTFRYRKYFQCVSSMFRQTRYFCLHTLYNFFLIILSFKQLINNGSIDKCASLLRAIGIMKDLIKKYENLLIKRNNKTRKMSNVPNPRVVKQASHCKFVFTRFSWSNAMKICTYSRGNFTRFL